MPAIDEVISCPVGYIVCCSSLTRSEQAAKTIQCQAENISSPNMERFNEMGELPDMVETEVSEAIRKNAYKYGIFLARSSSVHNHQASSHRLHHLTRITLAIHRNQQT